MSIIDKEDDIELLTTLLYSKYRSITHWTSNSLFTDSNIQWFIAILNRINELC